MFDFEPAYRQLRPSDRIFVDGYVNEIERYATRHNLHLENALHDYSPEDLDQRSKDILAQQVVRIAITERIKELVEQSELTVNKTLKELSNIGYSNIGNYFEPDAYGVPVFDLGKCTPEQLAAIKTIKIKESPTGYRDFEVVFHDKVAAIGMLMKYHGLLDAEQWRSEQKQKGQQKAISADQSVESAADLYARSING